MRLPSRARPRTSSAHRTARRRGDRPASRETPDGGGIICTVGHVGSNDAVGGGHRPAGHAHQRRRRRFVVPGAVRAPARGSASAWSDDHRRGATCGRSSACCAGVRCWPSSSTGATARMASRCACSAPGRRCRPVRRRSRRRPARGSCRSSDPRQPDDTLHVVVGRPHRRPVDRSGRPAARDPGDRRRPERDDRRRRPEQWYSFKPMWPATAEESADLERRATRHAGRTPGPGPRGTDPATRRPWPTSLTRPHGRPRSAPGSCIAAASWLACHLPEGPLVRARRSSPATSGTGWRRTARRRPGATSAGSAKRLAADGRGGRRWSARPRPTRARWNGSSGSAFRHNARYYLEVARTPAIRAGDLERAPDVETPERRRGGLRLRGGRHLRRAPLRRPSSCPRCSSPSASAAPSPRWRRSTIPGSRAGSCGPAARSASASSACARLAASCRPRSATARRSDSSATAT